MNKLMHVLVIGILFSITLVIALPTLPTPIPNGFQITMPNLPIANGQQLRGFCDYSGELIAKDIKVWNNYIDNDLETRLEYSFTINQPTCVMGFVGNITYINNPVLAIQQDFSQQILGSIVLPELPQQPIATGGTS